MDLTFGEFLIVAIVTVAVVSARLWPMLGQAIAERMGGRGRGPDGR